MNTKPEEKLDAALAKLPREIEPARDLWPGIAARIARHRVRAWPPAAWNVAAAAAVLAVAVATAWVILSSHAPAPGNQPVAVTTVPTGTAGEATDPRAQFLTQLASDTGLPPKARSALLDNLRMLHADILRTQAAVKKYPNDVNLQALLFNLYQQEAQLLNQAQQAQIQTTVRTEI